MSSKLAEAINLRKKVRSDGKRVIIDNFSPDKVKINIKLNDDIIESSDEDTHLSENWKEKYLELCNESIESDNQLQLSNKRARIDELTSSIQLKEQKIQTLISIMNDMKELKSECTEYLELEYYKLLTGIQLHVINNQLSYIIMENKKYNKILWLEISNASINNNTTSTTNTNSNSNNNTNNTNTNSNNTTNTNYTNSNSNSNTNTNSNISNNTSTYSCKITYTKNISLQLLQIYNYTFDTQQVCVINKSELCNVIQLFIICIYEEQES